jgi:hypothetical protein
MSGKADHYWRCGCGGGHFLSVTWWPGDASRTDIEFEGYLEVEGDFRSGWRHRIAMTWRMLRSGHAETRVGLILSQAKAREIAAVLTEFAACAGELGFKSPGSPAAEAAGAGSPVRLRDGGLSAGEKRRAENVRLTHFPGTPSFYPYGAEPRSADMRDLDYRRAYHRSWLPGRLSILTIRARRRLSGGIRELSRDEGRAMFDQRCREQMGISGEEFLARWDAGEYASIPDGENGRVMHLAMLIPFAR